MFARGAVLLGKRPLGPYMFFAKEKRPSVIQGEGANLKITEVAKKIGEMWRALSDAQKQEYKERAASAAKSAAKSAPKKASKK